MEYRLVMACDSNALSKSITFYLSNGWVLHGSPTCTPNGRVAQAVVKEG